MWALSGSGARRAVSVIAVGLIAAAVVGGCGSGAGVTEPTAKAGTNDARPLPKAALIRRGDRICSSSASRIEEELQRHKTEYGRGFGRQPTKKQSEEGVVDLVLPVIEDEAREISELPASPGDERQLGAIAAALRKGARETREDPNLALSGPNPLARAAALSKKFGFKVCGG